VVALLANKKDKALSDKYLLAWMLLSAIHLFAQYTFTTVSVLKFPFVYGILAPLPLIHGLFLYLYVASITNQLPKKRSILWLHIIPLTFFYLYLLRYYFFLTPLEQLKLIENEGAGHELFITTLLITTILSGIVYVLWSILLLKRHKKNILDSFSGLEKVDLRWIQFLIYGLAILWFVIILVREDEYIFTVAVAFIILTGYFGVQQVDIFKNRTKDTANTSIAEQKEKYAKSGLSEKASTDLYDELEKLMAEEAIYKQQELSIGELASKLNTHPNYLSQVINEKAGKRFYDYINTYRVEAFKELIEKPESKQFTMLSLAYDCGFNSKSSFNRFFKKATGQTPTQYLKA